MLSIYDAFLYPTLNVIDELRLSTGRSDYVICSPKEENEPMKWLTKVRKHISVNSKVPDFRPHDLRRTVVIYMAQLGLIGVMKDSQLKV